MTARSTLLRAAAVAAPLLALLAVVALASGSERPGAGGDVTATGSWLALKDSVLTIVSLAYLLAVVGLAVYAWRSRGRWTTPDRGFLQLRSIAGFLLFALALMAFVYADPERIREQVDALELWQVEPVSEQDATGGPGVEPARAAEFNWIAAAAFLALLGAIASWIVVRARMNRIDPVALGGGRVADALAAAVDDALVDVRTEPDLRRAVIAAYAQMERAAGSRGVPRRPHEAPFEYLARLLAELRVRPAAVLALTELFERARFSHHAIDPAMRDEAVAALGAVRDDLRPAAA